MSLRFRPDSGTSQRYALEQETRMRFEGGPMAEMGEQQLVLHMFVTQTVTGPVEGGTGVRMTFDSTRFSSPGASADETGQMDRILRRLWGTTGDLVLDERMRVVRATFSDVPGVPAAMGDQLGSAARGMTFPLPETPVAEGDSWTESIELPVGELPGNPPPLRAQTTLTLRGIRVADGDTTVLLGVETQMPTDPITATIQGRETTIRFEGTLEGEQEFSLTRGIQRSGAVGGVVRMTMSGAAPEAGALTLVMDQRMRMRALDEP